MFCRDILMTNQLDFTKTVTHFALMTSESMAHSTFVLMGYWLAE